MIAIDSRTITKVQGVGFLEIQFCMSNNHEKFILYFSSIGHHIISYIAQFEVEIPLVCGEIKKKKNLSRGRLD